MTQRSALVHTARLAALIAAAGFLFVAAASAQTPLPPPAYGNADARQDRIEELERQLRDATAENEQLQNRLNQANREVTRLRAMVGELAGVNQSLSSGQPPAAGPGAPEVGPAQPPAARPAAPDAVAPRGADANPAPSGLNSAQRAATGTLGTIPAGDAVPLPPVQRDPVADYSRARELLVNGQYAEAEDAFARFLDNHPRDSNAADARFWFAFTLLARNNYTDAAANFVQYLQSTPNGVRAPEAQVRLGMALIGMGDTRRGCGAFANLRQRYPNAPRSVRDLAAREARAANCSA
jgi:tol-pal system protein YbgF